MIAQTLRHLEHSSKGFRAASSSLGSGDSCRRWERTRTDTHTSPRAPACPPDRQVGPGHPTTVAHTVLPRAVPCMARPPRKLATPLSGRSRSVGAGPPTRADPSAWRRLKQGICRPRHPTLNERFVSHESDRVTTAAARLSCIKPVLAALVTHVWRLLLHNPLAPTQRHPQGRTQANENYSASLWIWRPMSPALVDSCETALLQHAWYHLARCCRRLQLATCATRSIRWICGFTATFRSE